MRCCNLSISNLKHYLHKYFHILCRYSNIYINIILGLEFFYATTICNNTFIQSISLIFVRTQFVISLCICGVYVDYFFLDPTVVYSWSY